MKQYSICIEPKKVFFDNIFCAGNLEVNSILLERETRVLIYTFFLFFSQSFIFARINYWILHIMLTLDSRIFDLRAASILLTTIFSQIHFNIRCNLNRLYRWIH